MSFLGFGFIFSLVVIVTLWCLWKMIPIGFRSEIGLFVSKNKYFIGGILGLLIILTMLYLGGS